ncbi:MAG TPA: energy transducer TonB, partial [Blastocatellia bacterium]
EEEFSKAPEISLRYNNDENPPVIITDARIKAVKRDDVYEKRGDQSIHSGDGYAFRSAVTFLNNSNRRAIGVTVELKDEKNKGFTFFANIPAGIKPGDSHTFTMMSTDLYYKQREDERAAGSSRAQAYSQLDVKTYLLKVDDPSVLIAKVVGVLFDDKYSWGMVPPPPPPPVPIDSTNVIRKSGGVLAGEAIHRETPDYPPLARAARVSGAVVVEIAIDENGDVFSARAVSGHPLLKDAAVEAARQWKFNPTMLEGRAVKVIGTLTFNFHP